MYRYRTLEFTLHELRRKLIKLVAQDAFELKFLVDAREEQVLYYQGL